MLVNEQSENFIFLDCNHLSIIDSFIHWFKHTNTMTHIYIGQYFIITYKARKMATKTSFSIHLSCCITLSCTTTPPAWPPSWMRAIGVGVGIAAGAGTAWRGTGDKRCCRSHYLYTSLPYFIPPLIVLTTSNLKTKATLDYEPNSGNQHYRAK